MGAQTPGAARRLRVAVRNRVADPRREADPCPGGHALADPCPGDHALGDHALEDHALGDHALADHALADPWAAAHPGGPWAAVHPEADRSRAGGRRVGGRTLEEAGRLVDRAAEGPEAGRIPGEEVLEGPAEQRLTVLRRRSTEHWMADSGLRNARNWSCFCWL